MVSMTACSEVSALLNRYRKTNQFGMFKKSQMIFHPDVLEQN